VVPASQCVESSDAPREPRLLVCGMQRGFRRRQSRMRRLGQYAHLASESSRGGPRQPSAHAANAQHVQPAARQEPRVRTKPGARCEVPDGSKSSERGLTGRLLLRTPEASSASCAAPLPSSPGGASSAGGLLRVVLCRSCL
jgi:hypothetical protein